MRDDHGLDGAKLDAWIIHEQHLDGDALCSECGHRDWAEDMLWIERLGVAMCETCYERHVRTVKRCVWCGASLASVHIEEPGRDYCASPDCESEGSSRSAAGMIGTEEE